MIYLHTYSFETSNKKAQKAQSKQLLLTNIAHYLNLDSDDVQLNYSENGKPSLTGLFFSISHSHNKLVQAFTFLGEIGLDIEFKNPKRNFLKLANKYFHKQEAGYLSTLNTFDAMHAFYTLWTTKEAICKEQGGRLWYYLDHNCLNEKNEMVTSFDGKNITQIKTLSNFSMSLATNFDDNHIVYCNE
jgi:4'-phosphopantetheinyl transferase